MSTTTNGSRPGAPVLITDGKRMRSVWRPGDGDGDGTVHVIERNMTTLKGHPTWRIFIEDIPEPIARGENEPPRYVYLDDATTYVVWKSGQYTNAELKTYWPFDFDHQGNIKTGRPNRGRPAWVAGDVLQIAKGKLRGKNKLYEFSGAPEMMDYKPLRPTGKTKMELEVEAEFAARKAQNAGDVEGGERTLATPFKDASTNMTTPGGTPIENSGIIPPSPPTLRTARLEKVAGLRSSPPKYPPPSGPKKQWQTPGRPVPSQSIKDGVKARPISSSLSAGRSPEEVAWHMRSSHSPMARRQSSPLNPKATSKRKFGPFLLSSSSSPTEDSSSEPKRTKVDRSGSLPASPSQRLNGNQGGEHRSSSLPHELPVPVPDVDSESDDEEDEFLASEFSQGASRFTTNLVRHRTSSQAGARLG